MQALGLDNEVRAQSNNNTQIHGNNNNHFQINNNHYHSNNNQFQGNNNINPNNNMNNMGFMPQMSPQQYQMMMQQNFEMQKQQARQIGQLLKKQKDLIEEMKRKEEERKKQENNREIIIFFNHNYDILPLTFKPDDLVAEVLYKYCSESNKQNVKFKFEGKELKMTNSMRLKEIEGLINGCEITVETNNQQ